MSQNPNATTSPIQGRDKGNKEEMVPGDYQVCGAETTLGLWTLVGC